MSSKTLDPLIEEFPEEKDAVKRLVHFIESSATTGPQVRELTAQRIFDIAHPSSQGILAKILLRLVQQGVLQKLVRVESDALGGIKDFDSITDVPPVLFDSRMGRDIEVRMDQIRLIYRLPRRATAS